MLWQVGWWTVAGQGYSYDAAGNMTHDLSTGNNYTYDQENRITGAVGYTYTYDADGNRVEKSNGTTGTLYWNMTPGIVAESDLAGNLQSEYVFFDGERVARRDFPSGNVAYYFSDNLKTASVITDATGNIKSESDYYPWGGELQFANGDSNHYKFTGKEHDSETQLDYFGARYYSNGLGRFITPDWAAKAAAVPYADFADPQSLNLYTYVRNLPTTRVDLDGHEDDDSGFFASIKSIFNKLVEPMQDAKTSHVAIPREDRLTPMTGTNMQQIVQTGAEKLAQGTEIVAGVVSLVDFTGLGNAVRSAGNSDPKGALAGMLLIAVPGGEDLSIGLREAKVAKNLEIVGKYSDAALGRSASKAEQSIAKHVDLLDKSPQEAQNSIKQDIRKAAERLEAIRQEQARRAAAAAQ
jgi:RHS repeat-associated protein